MCFENEFNMPDFDFTGKNKLLAQLNPEQRAAVTLQAEHALILAGAGSGKTRVLITRIAWLITTQQVSQHSVLAVTFTNKAAKEMTSRLSAMLQINPRGMWIGTFHGLCHRFLRLHFKEANLPQLFHILDSADQLSAVKRMLKNLNVDDEKYPPKELCNFINAHKEEGIRANAAEAFDAFSKRRVELYAEYEAQCNREGVVDFAELLLRTYEVLQKNEPLCRHYQERFKHILVDEFQDTNRLQYKWLKLLAGEQKSLQKTLQNPPQTTENPPKTAIFAVGDDDQSIYAFRGADVGNMNAFTREFAIQNIIRLEQNYRSYGNILAAANALIQNNNNRLGKKLWTDAGNGEPLRVFTAPSDIAEAEFVVEEIRALIRDGLDKTQLAILYRSNAQSRVLEHQLFISGVPYRVYGGLRFFDRQEVKHALAYLRLIANADDDTAFSRIVNFPKRGIGARAIENLQAIAHQNNCSLYNAAASLSGKSGANIGQFIRLIESLRHEITHLPLPEIIEYLLEQSGIRAHYLADKEGRERLDNLDELLNAATRFTEDDLTHLATENDPNLLASFLAHASLEAGDNQASGTEDAVQMMSVHAAKGLEFDAVFITGLEHGLFPHDRANSEENGLEEERRLMYVAITRAKKRLYLSHAETRLLHGQMRFALASQFLEELPETLLKRIGNVKTSKNYSENFFQSAPSLTKNAHEIIENHGNFAGFSIGQHVLHAKFGEGMIVGGEGFGADARVLVNFKHAGEKWLSLSFAKLTVL